MKGFVYTLESVIASTLIISMILVVVPQISGSPETNLEPAMTGIQSADQNGNLGDSPENISESLNEFIPETFNFSIRTTETKTTDIRLTGEEEIELQGGYKKVLLWVEDADNLEATYRSETVLQTSETGYKEIELSPESGYLNFTADNVELDGEINRYRTKGDVLDSNTVYSIGYINIEEEVREIQVMLST